jgi:uncharacterized membrane protein YbhN (UPF0104 family)/tRNA A-37 threonylcarbamoyl transferase component Bud32
VIDPERQASGDRHARVRRPVDLLLALVAAVPIAVIFFTAHALPIGTTEVTDNVAHWFTRHVPHGLADTFASVAALGAFAFAVAASVEMIRKAHRDAVNAVIAGLVSAGWTTACVVAWRGRRAGIATAMLLGTNATALVLTVGFVGFVTGADLTRRPRWTKWCVLAVAPLIVGELALNELTLFAAFAVPLMGWGTGLIVRWGARASSVRPTAAELQSWLRSQGIDVTTLEMADGGAAFDGHGADGRPVTISLANRDTRGAGIARRIWHILRLRGAVTGPELLSSRSQLEREALAAYILASAGVVAPRVLLLAELPPETLVLCLALPGGGPLCESTAPGALARVFAALRSMHNAGVAHRDLRPHCIVVDGEGPGFSSVSRAQPGAGELVRRIDVAQLLTTSARCLGASVAVKAFRDGYEPEDETAIASVLQPLALTMWGWSAMRGASACLTAVRHELLGPSGGGAAPQRLERFRWRTVVSTVALTIAAFVLVGQLSRVHLLEALGSMNLAWFLVALVGSALTYLGAALNLAAFVPKQLSIVRGFLVQLSSAFIGVAMPPTVGHVAVNSRYLHRQGVDQGTIAAAIAVSQIVNIATTIPLLVIIGVLTGSGVGRFHIAPGANLLIGIACIAALVGLVFAIPHPRRIVNAYVWPKVRSAVPRLLDAISQPARLVVGVGGNLLLTVGYVVALLASLYAVGAHPPILATAAIYLAGNTVGSIAPTPGGLGAVEAVMSAGLTAIGIPAHEAFPAVLIFRAATFWLPIPSGWLSYVMLSRSGTL